MRFDTRATLGGPLTFKRYAREGSMIRSDPWLDRWFSLLDARCGGCAVLELGCGDGRDTAALTKAGHRVIAIDISRLAILAAKVRAPNATFYRQDILDPFPVRESATGAIVAALSLHYFSWIETVNLVQRIRQTLQPKGGPAMPSQFNPRCQFWCRGHECISENYYLVDGQPKRFFDEQSVNGLFSEGWNVLNLEHVTIDRYALRKPFGKLSLSATLSPSAASRCLERSPSRRFCRKTSAS